MLYLCSSYIIGRFKNPNPYNKYMAKKYIEGKKVVFVDLSNPYHKPFNFRLDELKDKFVIDSSPGELPRPILVTETGLWGRRTIGDNESYDKYSIDFYDTLGLRLSVSGSGGRKDVERLRIPQDIERLEELFSENFTSAPQKGRN